MIGKPSERKGKSLDGWLDNAIGLSSEQAGERAVRDGDPSIDVIALMRDAEGQIHTVSDECERVIPADRPPSREEALLIARQKLRLPGFSADGGISTARLRSLRVKPKAIFRMAGFGAAEGGACSAFR